MSISGAERPTVGAAEGPDARGDEIIRRPRRSNRKPLLMVMVIAVAIIIVVVGADAAGLFGTGSKSQWSCPPPVETLTGAGSTLVAPLMYDWETAYSGSIVNYDSIGSGGGIAQITAKTVDFGASDAPLSPTQRAAIPSPGVLTIPESIGGAVPIYNLPTVSQTLKFTGSILAGIYLGDITNWNNTALQAVNPGVTLPDANIVVVFRSDGSGTTFIWTSFLSAENATWRNTVGYSTALSFPTGAGAKGNAGVTQTVKSTVDAIGYVDINYALTEGLPFGAVQNPAGNFVEANLTNIASAVQDSNVAFPSPSGDWYNVSVENAPGSQDYPISSFTYLFVYKDLGQAYGSAYTPAKAQNLVRFLSWVVSSTGGQIYSSPLYYVPLSSQASSFDLSAIDSITYDGAAIPLCTSGSTSSS